jgi:hypothetical protein
VLPPGPGIEVTCGAALKGFEPAMWILLVS